MKRNILWTVSLTLFLASCSKTIDNTGTCSDGILNHGEQQVDCGGPCPNHCESCADGIRNQGETAVDCGGPCDPCYPRVSALVDGSGWNSHSRNAQVTGPASFRIYGTGPGGSVTLDYSGPFEEGTIATGPGFNASFRDESGRIFSSATIGSIRFTTFDTISHQVSGTFSFIGKENGTAATRNVSNGIFNVLPY